MKVGCWKAGDELMPPTKFDNILLLDFWLVVKLDFTLLLFNEFVIELPTKRRQKEHLNSSH